MRPQRRTVSRATGAITPIASVCVVLCVAGAAFADGEGGRVNLWPFIEPTGLVTLSLIVITAGLAALRKIRPRTMLKLHRIFAALAVLSALCHATLVLLSG